MKMEKISIRMAFNVEFKCTPEESSGTQATLSASASNPIGGVGSCAPKFAA